MGGVDRVRSVSFFNTLALVVDERRAANECTVDITSHEGRAHDWRACMQIGFEGGAMVRPVRIRGAKCTELLGRGAEGSLTCVLHCRAFEVDGLGHRILLRGRAALLIGTACVEDRASGGWKGGMVGSAAGGG